MRVHTAPHQSNEKKILHALLMICLGLGFVSAAAVYLPHHLQSRGVKHRDRAQLATLSSVIPSIDTAAPKSSPTPADEGPVFRFVPEQEPPLPPTTAQSQLAPVEDESTKPSPLLEPLFPLDAGKPQSVRHPVSSLVDGSALHASRHGERWWKTPPGLEADVKFWKDIYTTYTSSQVVLHDPEHLHLIYDVLDFGKIDANSSLTDEQKQKIRSDRTKDEIEQITAMLKRLDHNREAALRTKRGRAIARLFATIDEPEKFKAAYERGVRAQTGQRDKFIEGLKRSGAYLGEIETIFKSYGLPRELTRMIFVESMFQTDALSKAGAAGIWQFMPGTGKKYLRINRFVDERLDPLLATHAAAKLLKHNYEVLGTWPLAINAYNAGRGRLMQAVKRLGTDDIGTIIRNFDHPNYGFASRNFFLEFVAAREIVDNAQRYFGTIEFDDPLRYDVVDLPFHISLNEVSKLSGISLDELYALNPALSQRIYSGDLPVPMGTTVRVPEHQGEHFLQLASRGLNTTTAPLPHRVARGESLQSIALMYGVSVEQLREANPKLKRKPRRGQTLYIPF